MAISIAEVNMQVFSFSPFGYEGSLVSVEVDLRRGIPAVDIVGLADCAVKESRERMASAIRNSGFEFPPERVLISLSPADLRKEGAGFDLAVALAVLYRKQCLNDGGKIENDVDVCKNELEVAYKVENCDQELTDAILVMGELELNGRVRPVRGVHAAVSTALASGIRMCIVPKSNCDEAREIDGMKVFGAENLTEAFEALFNPHLFSSGNTREREKLDLPEGSVCVDGVYFGPVESGYEFAEIKNQHKLVRALQIAATGGHNVLAFGPPGCGKTLSLQRFPSLLPLLTLEESQPVTRIYSIAGLLGSGRSILRKMPFRQPHQTATIEGICGGGPKCSPGEISLAHNGVLFLDEAAEFRSSVLQMLRVPLESGSITLSRAGRSTVFPARFQLLMATNPCPCGNYGSKDKLCLCSARSVEQYWKKFSAPLLDRIELRIQVETKGDSSSNEPVSISTEELRKKIACGINAQRKRQGKKNVYLTPTEIAEYCVLSDESRSFLEEQTERNGFSPRAVAGIMKVSRTIADLEGKKDIDLECIKEAVEYRKGSGVLTEGFI